MIGMKEAKHFVLCSSVRLMCLMLLSTGAMHVKGDLYTTVQKLEVSKIVFKKLMHLFRKNAINQSKMRNVFCEVTIDFYLNKCSF